MNLKPPRSEMWKRLVHYSRKSSVPGHIIQYMFFENKTKFSKTSPYGPAWKLRHMREIHAGRSLNAFLRPYGLLFREWDCNDPVIHRFQDRVAALATFRDDLPSLLNQHRDDFL